MDDGAGGTFVEVVGFTEKHTLNSVLITNGIVSGSTYRLKYRAKNIHGWGSFSEAAYILAATVPSAPVGEPQTKVLTDETDVTIAWQAPSSFGGANVPIEFYNVEILMPNQSFE
jgi:hypothetical protein